MHGSSRRIRNQVGIAHGHGNRLVPHQRLDAVDVRPSQCQPGSEGVSQGMENNFMPGSFGVFIKANFLNKVGKSMNKGTPFFATLRWRKDQTRLPSARKPTLKKSFHIRIDKDLPPRFSVYFFSYGDDAMCYVNVNPFQTENFPQSHSSIQGNDNSCMQVCVTTFHSCFEKCVCLFIAEKTFSGVPGFRQGHAGQWTLPCKQWDAIDQNRTGQIEGTPQNCHVVECRGFRQPTLSQKIQENLDIFLGNGIKREGAQFGMDVFFNTTFIILPGALRALCFRQVIFGEKGGKRYGLNPGQLRLMRLRSSTRLGLGAKGTQTLCPRACCYALLNFGEHLVGFFGVPAIRSPSQAFLTVFVLDIITYAEVTIRFAIVLASRMLSEADAGVGGAVPSCSHDPGIVPERIPVKVRHGTGNARYLSDLIIPGMSGEVRFFRFIGLRIRRPGVRISPGAPGILGGYRCCRADAFISHARRSPRCTPCSRGGPHRSSRPGNSAGPSARAAAGRRNGRQALPPGPDCPAPAQTARRRV